MPKKPETEAGLSIEKLWVALGSRTNALHWCFYFILRENFPTAFKQYDNRNSIFMHRNGKPQDSLPLYKSNLKSTLKNISHHV